jgi:cell wall-associated NlpC family hydrolase
MKAYQSFLILMAILAIILDALFNYGCGTIASNKLSPQPPNHSFENNNSIPKPDKVTRDSPALEPNTPFPSQFALSQTEEEITRVRNNILQIAKAYVNHRWYSTDKNIFHGKDATGYQIDTPDIGISGGWWVPNQWNIGVPYQWGGFSSISGLGLTNEMDFDAQIVGSYNGIIHFAGDKNTNKTNGSRMAAGVDCSGFVSRCWNLSRRMNTKTLPEICTPVMFDQLQPGDILLHPPGASQTNPHGHVMLFEGFTNGNKTSFRVYEASGRDWRVSEREYMAASILKSAAGQQGYGARLEYHGQKKDFWAFIKTNLP